jgi:hypothetical protein
MSESLDLSPSLRRAARVARFDGWFVLDPKTIGDLGRTFVLFARRQ